YMIHCHNLVHEDHDMMTQFEMIEKDAQGNILRGPEPCSAPAQRIENAKPLGSEPTPPLMPKSLPASCAVVFPTTQPQCQAAQPNA
ncbi:MAG TPA: hypothetical protein V6D19_06785, partial [Stenomitos sp.]